MQGKDSEPIDWIYKSKYYPASYLLDNGEKFSRNSQNQHIIIDSKGNTTSIQERLKDVYDALFVKKNEDDVIPVGEMLFNKSTVQKLLKSTSMLKN